MNNGEDNKSLAPAPASGLGFRLKIIARNLHAIFTRDLSALWRQQLSEIEQRFSVRADQHEAAIDARFDERSAAIEQNLNRRQDAYQNLLDARLDERFTATEKRLDSQFVNNAQMLDNRFDSRAAAADARLDERLAAIDRYIDQRFNALEERTDQRMEAHERLVDGKLHHNRQDIVDRTDLLLQVFEQRLDKQRRDLNKLGESLRASVSRQLSPPHESVASGSSSSESLSAGGSVDATGNGAGAVTMIDQQSPQTQLLSFRKLAAASGLAPKPKLLAPESALYERILEWKKIAHQDLHSFTPDEQETVDYILSFISDPKEQAYTRQHLRRFVATLQRIPPARKSRESLLELGSLTHLAPAIRKFCGYTDVCCADFWEADEKVTSVTLRQANGPDSYTFELRNFNVEADPFPYPDNHFSVVLCCELIEHLQRDPMHMLWECNRVLRPDGFLLLTTPNIASARAIEGLLVGCSPYLLSQYNLKTPVDQHNREYAPYEIGLALAAAGFTVVELETEDVWLRSNPAILELLRKVDITTELRGDNIFALARKTSAPVERYPKELYIE
jgi:SAM-dependent methyltransferase